MDGLDGIGKGVIIQSLKETLAEKNKKVLDLEDYWNEKHLMPQFFLKKNQRKELQLDFLDLNEFDALISHEPTRIGIGYIIRKEFVARSNRSYGVETIAQAYALDRLALYKRVLLPCLNAGKTIIQSRGLASSLTYQQLMGLSKERLLELEGNKFTLSQAPDLLIIPTIKDPAELIKRLKERKKFDNAIFEDLEFQAKLKPLYESDWLKKLFEEQGTVVEYLDAGISIEKTKKQAREILLKHLPE